MKLEALRREVDDDGAELGRVTEPPQGNVLLDQLAASRAREECLVHGGEKVARAQRIDPDIVARQLERHHPRELHEGGLARAVGRQARDGPHRPHGRDVDDAPALALHHGPRRRLRAERRAAEIDVEHSVPIARLDIQERPVLPRDAGIVDEHVDPPEGPEGALHHALDVGGLPQVGGEAFRADTLPGSLRGHGVQVRAASPRERQIGAGLREGQGHGPPEPSARPRHQRHRAADVDAERHAAHPPAGMSITARTLRWERPARRARRDLRERHARGRLAIPTSGHSVPECPVGHIVRSIASACSITPPLAGSPESRGRRPTPP